MRSHYSAIHDKKGGNVINISAVRYMLVSVFFFCALLAFPALSRSEAAGPFTVEIADVGKSQEFAALLQKKGFATAIPAKNMWVVDQQSNCVVWIGRNIPLDMLRVVLPEAYRFNPYLKFFHVVGDRGEQPPRKVDDTLHIGGNIEAALVKKLNTLDKEELLATMGKVATAEELHKYLHEKNKAGEADKDKDKDKD